MCCECVCVVAQSSLTLCNCSLSGSFVHGISQTRILEWIAMSSSRRSSQPRSLTWVLSIAGRFFTVWAKIDRKCSINVPWMDEWSAFSAAGDIIPLVCPTLCPLYLVVASPSLRELHPHSNPAESSFLFLVTWPGWSNQSLSQDFSPGDWKGLFPLHSWGQRVGGPAPAFLTDKDEVIFTKRQRWKLKRGCPGPLVVLWLGYVKKWNPHFFIKQ